MRYEDASNSGAFQGSEPIANDDFDSLPAGAKTPATGNLITGEGTQSGSAGADMAAGGHIISIAGKGGEDSSFSAGKLDVAGEFGRLSVDAQGNYTYRANAGIENVRDRFTYTLADNQGNQATAALTVEIGKTPVVIQANAQQVVPGPDGVVMLPPGVDLSDIMIVGRNLVVMLPDGTQMIIIDGAVFVPQLVIDGVEVPASNVAALLIGQEPQPAAGETPPSSGGNFALPPPPLDPGVPLGDLIPPTVYTYTPPEVREVFDILDREPEIFIDPGNGIPVINAIDSVNEAGLPTRNGGEPAGSGEAADGNPSNDSDPSEATTGTILYTSPDGVSSITINGVAITSVGQVFNGTYGTLTITSIAPGAIGYRYLLLDNTSGDNTADNFIVSITDTDGDVATATLAVQIVDDVPIARPDTDTVAAGTYGPELGNVMTGVGTTSGSAGADTVGADNATLTGATGAGATTAISGGFQVVGQYGVLTISSTGDYSYVRNPGTPGGVQDVFNYTITDGDGDARSTTLTINIADAMPETRPNPTVLLDDDALANGNPGGVGDDPDSQNASGFLTGVGGDGPLTFNVLLTGAPTGFTYESGGSGVVLVKQGGVTVLTITVNSTTGAYTVVQNAPINHAAGGDENNQLFTINYSVTDVDGDSAPGTININVDDDTPIALQVVVTGVVDEDGLAGGNPGGVGDVPGESLVATGSVTSLFASGADTPLTYSLLANTAGLPALTSGGVAVTYAVVGNTLTASAGGATVFTFTLNANGNWTFTLASKLDHPAGNNENDINVSLGSIIQATDNDGDSVTALAGGLVITIDDDTPIARNDTDSIDGGGLTATGNVITGAGTTSGVAGADSPGADSPSTITAISGTGGTDTTFSGGFLDIAGTYGSLQIDANGNYTYTRANGAPGTFQDVFTYTLTDSDGDSVTATLTINIQDRAPIAGTINATLDDDALANGNPGGVGDDTPDTSNLTGNLPGSGGDGALTWAVLLTGAPAGFTYVSGGAGIVLIQQGGVTKITVTFNSATGAYTIVQNLPIDHAPGGNENNQLFTLNYTVTDADGDSAPGTININVDDDTPIATSTLLTGTVDEDGLPGGIPGGVGDVPGEALSASGNVAALFASGADTPLTYQLLSSFGGLPALTSGGVAVTYAVTLNAGVYTLTASAGANTVFTFTLNATSGAYNFTLVRPLDHPTLNGMVGDDTENDINISLGSIIQATDKDGDSVVANAGGLIITVDDDTPIARNDTDAVTSGGNSTGGNVITGAGTTSGAAGADSPGADGPAKVVAIASNNVPANVDTTPDGANNYQVAGQYGSLVINQDGTYTYTRSGGTPGDVQDVFTYTYEDADGDKVTATLTITINDAAPTAGSVNATLDDDALANGNPGGVGDDTPDTSNLTGNLPGSGGDGALTWAVLLTGAPAGFTYVSGGAGIVLIQQGGVTKITVTFNSATGAYTIVQNLPIDHAPGGNENNQLFTLNYTVTDADGDSAPGTININVDDDTPIATSTLLTGTVDEDGLPGGIPGGVGDVPGEALSASGNVAALFASGADTPLTYSLINASSLNALGLASGGVSLSYQITVNLGVYTLTASAGANTVFTFTLDATTGAYNFTLVRPLDHPAGNNENDINISLGGIIQATDKDGDSVVANAGGLVITVDDDSPTASANAAVQLDDDALTGGNPGGIGDVNPDTANLTGTLGHNFGADGAGTIAFLTSGAPAGFTYELSGNNLLIKQGGVTVITVTLNPTTGAYTVTQNAPVGHAAGGDENDIAFVLTYRVTDRDSDTADGTLTINVDDDTPTVSANAVVQLDDDALSGGNPGGVGDDPNAVNVNGTLGHSFGADGAGSIAYLTTGAPAGFTYELSGGNLLVKQGGVTVLTLTVNSTTGAYTVVQNAPIQHPAGANENNVIFSIGYRVTDGDGDFVDGTLTVNVDDDTPTLGTIQGGTANNNPAAAHSFGSLHFSTGADSPASVTNITTTIPVGTTSGGKALVTHYSNGVLTAYQDSNGNGSYDAGIDTVQVFTLTVNPTGGPGGGTWDFDLITALDPTVTDTPIGSSSSFGAGPTLGQVLQNAAGTQALSVVSGYHPTGSFNATSWFTTGVLNSADVTSTGVNGSTAGWGVDNNNFENPDEIMFFDFGAQALADPDGGGAYVPPAVALPNITFARFDFINYKAGAGDAGDDIAYVIHYVDAMGNPAGFASGFVPDANINGATWTISAPGGLFIADIQFFSGREPSGAVQDLAPGKIDLVSVGVETTNISKNIGFNVTLSDSDGDTVSGGFTLNLATGNSPSVAVAPVAIDLNGDGVHFLAADAGVKYDYDGDGVKEATAWVGPQDGILVRDANGNGTVDGASEFVFGRDGLTDLQALRALYGDTLDADDADFGQFGVWQDANSNGVADDGEFQSLTALGITSINLTGDGVSYTAANGDVDVAGSATFTRADGSTGIVADASFWTGSAAAFEQRVLANSASNVALAAAIAAAGLAAGQAAANPGGDDDGQSHGDGSSGGNASLAGSSAPEEDGGSRSALANETREAVDDEDSSASSSNSSHAVESGHSLEGSHAAAPANDAHSAADGNHGASADAAAMPLPPAVAMVSAAALQAAGLQGGVQQGGSVEQILADALGHGAPPSVDGLLAALGVGGPGNAHVQIASPVDMSVPAWDMAAHGAFASGFDMMFKMDAQMLHHDAVQPVING